MDGIGGLRRFSLDGRCGLLLSAIVKEIGQFSGRCLLARPGPSTYGLRFDKRDEGAISCSAFSPSVIWARYVQLARKKSKACRCSGSLVGGMRSRFTALVGEVRAR